MFFGNYLQLDELGDNAVLEMNEFYRRIIGLMDWCPAFHTRPDTMLSSAQQPGTARFEIIPNLALLYRFKVAPSRNTWLHGVGLLHSEWCMDQNVTHWSGHYNCMPDFALLRATVV